MNIPGNGVTTPLGLGLATLMREPSAARQQYLLDAAYEAGIRHFDVAPSYGLGAAEQALGRFLRRAPRDATVGTKVGIRARGNVSIMRLVQRPARALMRAFPGLRGRATSAVGSVVHAAPDFNIKSCTASLERSLRSLGVERIDLLLLHEPRPGDIGDGRVVEWLRAQKRRGVVSSVGIATTPDSAAAIVAAHPGAFDVVQVPAHILAPPHELLRSSDGPMTIIHSVLAAPMATLRSRASSDAAWARELERRTGIDIGDTAAVARLLLAWAIHENRRGIVLLGASTEAHIRSAPAAGDGFDAERLRGAGDFLRQSLAV